MSNEILPLDLSGLEVASIDVLSADSIVVEGHGAIETGASSYSPYCSSYMQACSCWVPEQ
ncbi:hypothetical protein ETD86_39760 [Nonomuraea turkmeniaca]|uniref:Uncharacterized protein n=1 Tax=Nonomuraea turkmeniaca TaxID=103838 RepID=A0A5S4F2N0_9ACTN|nr:hypothetical protein [Nonomuraea turkmeniaca]TMR10373.1 hypothetical protein ETD86_39760 [Nonomuraea turkmeniaca]